MRKQLQTVSPFDAIRKVNEQGQEYWSARDLQGLLGYDRWENFEETIERAMISYKNSGHKSSEQVANVGKIVVTGNNETGWHVGPAKPINNGNNVEDHFRDVTKMIALGKGAERKIKDYDLTRFACYLTAMNGDPRKPEIAAAQSYFAIKTREAELGTAKRGRPKKSVETPVEIERIGDPPYFLSDPYPDLLAEEIAGFAENGDSTDLSDILQEYLLYMNEPLSLTCIRKECEAFQLMPLGILKTALKDCVDFGCIETVKVGNSTCYQIPEYLKPQSRALVIFSPKES